MHELFELTEVLPVAPGQSPFHVKGLYYTRLLDHARSLPGGRSAFFKELKDERLPEFYSQRFGWSKWYDALPTMPAHIALARARGADFETLTRERGKLAGQAIVPAMFRAVLALASPQAMAQHMPRMLMANFDFMRHQGVRIERSSGVGETSAIPRILAPSVSNTVMGFIEGVLDLAGYTQVRARYTDVVEDGVQEGFPTVTVRYEFSWGPRA